MTTAQTTATPGAPDGQSPRRSRGDIAVGFADQIAHAEFRRGDLADLRRMDPDEPDAAVFWRLLAQQDLLGDPAVESRWALILHGIALMTPTSSGDGVAHTAHNGNIPVGWALFLGGEVRRVKGLYSETRFNRLLTARGPMLRTLLARMFRMLAAANVSFNWREMAQFILNEGDDEEAAEQARRRMARAYYQAERRSAQASDD
jgi:CRISPR type I-E-associated protein CasB/Cse2